MPIVNFIKEKKKVDVPTGSNLRKEALKAGIEIYPGIHKTLNCRGFGQCASCRVRIKKGVENVPKAGWFERLRLFLGPLTFFARLGCEDELRLSCKTKVNGDIDVETQPAINWHGEKFWG